MFKQAVLLIVLSVLAIMGQAQLMGVLKGFFFVHHQIANGLGLIFSESKVGEIVQSVLALLLIPIVVGVLMAVAHFFLRQIHFPHTMSVIWVTWAVCLAAVLAHSGRVSNQDLAGPAQSDYHTMPAKATDGKASPQDAAKKGAMTTSQQQDPNLAQMAPMPAEGDQSQPA